MTTQPTIAPPFETWQGWTRYRASDAWVRPSRDWKPSAENARAAYEVLDQIDAHPESWDQGVYWCGSGGCFAGWRCVLSGETPDFCSDGEVLKVTWQLTSGQRIDTRAAQLLGFPDGYALDEYAADVIEDGFTDLFSGSNDRDDLGHIVLAVFGPRPDGM